MRRAVTILVGTLFLLVAAVAAAYIVLVERIKATGPLAQETTVVIPRGSGSQAMAILLADAGVIESPWLFLAARALEEIADRNGPGLKAGEYAFAAHVAVAGVLEQLRDGRTVVHRLTVPEGLTTQQILTLVKAEPALSGDPGMAPGEGALLPQTYHFSLGDSRAQLVERMHKGMSRLVAEAWVGRAEGLPLSNPNQAVTLASIVEKETGVPAERPRVAGVFINRLRAGMKLQSDPTVIYAVTGGKADFGRPISKTDLKTESPYNTYFAEGLPPGPIANPGRAAIEAVLHPEAHEFLYFVADGSGGHVFARTLAEHNRNVQRWREVHDQAQKGEAAASSGGPPPAVKGDK